MRYEVQWHLFGLPGWNTIASFTSILSAAVRLRRLEAEADEFCLIDYRIKVITS